MPIINLSEKTKKFISITFLIFAILLGGYYAIWNNYWSDGDEFHYIVMAESFAKDGDFDLSNEFSEKNYLTHHGKEEKPHGHLTKFNQLRSHHNILLPILISPGYIARGLLGARLVVWVFCVLSLIVLIEYQKKIGLNNNNNYITTALFILQMPILVYSQYAYTDLLSGYFVLLASFFLLSYTKSKKLIELVFASLIFGITSFLHIKIVQYAGLILGFFFIWQITKGLKYFRLKEIIKNKKNISLAIYTFLPWVLINLLFTFTMYRWYGEFNPAAAHNLDLANQEIFTTFYVYNPFLILKNLFGLILGGESGLLPNAPLFILMFPGLYIWFKKDRKTFFIFAIPTILFFLRQAMFVKWRTWGPPARYLMIMLPIMLPSVGYSIKYLHRKTIGKILISSILMINLAFYYLLFQLNRGGYPTWENYNTYWQSIFVKLGNNGLILSNYTFIDLINPNFNDYIKIGIVCIFAYIIYWYTIKIYKKHS